MGLCTDGVKREPWGGDGDGGGVSRVEGGFQGEKKVGENFKLAIAVEGLRRMGGGKRVS